MSFSQMVKTNPVSYTHLDLRKKNGHEKPWKLDFFGVGNENWGCGGNMNPDFYANEYRRYQTYVRNYHPDHPIHKVCCGANVDDYEWTSEVLKTTHNHCLKDVYKRQDGDILREIVKDYNESNEDGIKVDIDIMDEMCIRDRLIIGMIFVIISSM